jgi:hypothetical protein
MRKMKDKYPLRTDEGARRMIFFGVSAVPIAGLVAVGPQMEHFVGEKALPYVFFGIVVIITLIGMILYHHTPKRLVIPIGIIGWLIAASFLCWYAWFGPGAFRYVRHGW